MTLLPGELWGEGGAFGLKEVEVAAGSNMLMMQQMGPLSEARQRVEVTFACFTMALDL